MLGLSHTLDDRHLVNALAFEDCAAKAGEHANRGVFGKDDRNLHAPALECDLEPVSVPFDKGREVNEELGHSIHASPSVSCGSPTQYRTVVTESVANAAATQSFPNNRIRARSSLRAAKRARVSPPLPRARTIIGRLIPPVSRCERTGAALLKNRNTALLRFGVNCVAARAGFLHRPPLHVAETGQARTFSRMATTMQPRQSDHCQITLRSLEGPLGIIHRQARGTPIGCDSDPAQTMRHVSASRGLVCTSHHIRPHFARREHGRGRASSQL